MSLVCTWYGSKDSNEKIRLPPPLLPLPLPLPLLLLLLLPETALPPVIPVMTTTSTSEGVAALPRWFEPIDVTAICIHGTPTLVTDDRTPPLFPPLPSSPSTAVAVAVAVAVAAAASALAPPPSSSSSSSMAGTAHSATSPGVVKYTSLVLWMATTPPPDEMTYPFTENTVSGNLAAETDALPPVPVPAAAVAVAAAAAGWRRV